MLLLPLMSWTLTLLANSGNSLYRKHDALAAGDW